MYKFMVFFTFILASNGVFAGAEPKLKDFKVEAISKCTAKNLDHASLIDKYPNSVRLMKETMRLRRKADFAGHYYVVTLPTPKGGVYTIAMIDCLNGKQVASLPDYYTIYIEEENSNGYEFRYLASSRLFVIDGVVSDADLAEMYKTKYYEMTNGKLKLIKEGPARIISK